MKKLQIRMLGTFNVRESGREISFATRRTQALFAYLAHTGTVHTREHLSSVLWDSVPTLTSTGNLRVLLTNLRHTVAPYVDITRTTVAFRPSPGAVVSIDAHVFARRADALLPSGGTDLNQPEQRALEAALGWCKGHFLEGLDIPKASRFDDWLHHERKAVNDRRIALLRELIETELALAADEAAVAHSAQLLELDPLNETSHQLAIRARVLAGDLDAAVEHFESLESMLADEFSAAPSTRSRALLAGLPARKPRGPRSRVVTVAARPDGATARTPWSRFVGRQRELATILEAYAAAAAGSGGGLLVRGECGSGKTVLVRQAVRLLLDRDPAAVVLAAACTDVTGDRDDAITMSGLAAQLRGEVDGSWIDGAIPAAVAQRLLTHRHAPVAPERPDAPVVAEGVRRISNTRPVVLLLDNVQWAGRGVAALIGELATDARHRRVLLACVGRSELLEGPAAPDAARRLVPRLLRHFAGRVVDLDEIDSDASGFANMLVDSEPNTFDTEFRAALLHRSQGHPQFTAELLRDLANRSVITRDSSSRYRATTPIGWGCLPKRVQSLIDERLSHVPSAHHRLLRAAAVVGEEFPAEVVSAVTDTALGDVIESFGTVLGRRGLHLLETSAPAISGAAPTYRFRHVMVREHLERSADAGIRHYLRNQLHSNGWSAAAQASS